MKNRLSKKPDLLHRLSALQQLDLVAENRIEDADRYAISSLLSRSEERMRIGSGLTVVALAGATGSGKSSLFNSLSGAPLSEVGVRRPTTGVAHAASWGASAEAGQLLDHLQIQRRHFPVESSLEGLVLLDLPDHDSTETRHRLEVDRLVELVDIFMWVVDPEKYADAALHEGYLKPLAHYADVTIVVLNQIDRLEPEEVRRCSADMNRLLKEDGLKKVVLVPTSVRTGTGLDELRRVITERVESERAAGARLLADLETIAERLRPYCAATDEGKIDNKARDALQQALSEAAGVRHVARAVGASHRRDAALAMGWPFTRWLRRLRPDPLGRLHLRRASNSGRTSLPEPTGIQRAGVENAIRRVARSAGEHSGAPWTNSLYRAAADETAEIEADLDRTIATAELSSEKQPLWWSFVNGLQILLATAALTGFAWLTILFAFQWFQIPKPPTPETRDIPWPTLLLAGGLLTGFLLAVITGRLTSVAARRRTRRAERLLGSRVAEVGQRRILLPIETELAQRSTFCQALRKLTS